MKDLFHCRTCGFLSTVRTAYKNVNVEGEIALVCLERIQDYKDEDLVIDRAISKPESETNDRTMIKLSSRYAHD